MPHPLDRPAWTALATRHAAFAIGDPALALRYRPEVNMFGAAADRSDAALGALAALVPDDGALGLVETDDWPIPPGLVAEARPPILQMVAPALRPGPAATDFVALGDADAPEMLALARLTDPGPFFPATHRLGGFIGVREAGRLIAMAGERMKADGFCEVSAVCTHPDHRGRGLAGSLMRVVADRILARGEQPFLHSYAANEGAVRLYEALGFQTRATIRFTLLRRR